jgi:hypothetical protein
MSAIKSVVFSEVVEIAEYDLSDDELVEKQMAWMAIHSMIKKNKKIMLYEIDKIRRRQEGVSFAIASKRWSFYAALISWDCNECVKTCFCKGGVSIK